MKKIKTLENLKSESFKLKKNDCRIIGKGGDGGAKCVWQWENGRLRDSMIFYS